MADVAHARGLHLHMDGARIANAITWLGCTPAAVTWQAGVDALSFGVSKNGALAAEAIVVFGHPEWMSGLERPRKRGGHLVSKMRFVSAQLLAMLEGGLWLELAAHANRQAQRLAAAIEAQPGASLAWPVEANEVFLRAEPAKLEALRNQGFESHFWPGHDDLARLVCSFATEDDAVSHFIRALDQ